MPTRRRARIIAFQILYSMSYNPVDVDEAARRYFVLEKERKKPLPSFALDLARAAREHQDALDTRINAHLQHWRPERLTLPDRILLRLACAELYHFNDIPPKVTLDEYIELARQFSDDGAPAFVNGVLDAVLKAEPLPEGKCTEAPTLKKKRRGRSRSPKTPLPNSVQPTEPKSEL